MRFIIPIAALAAAVLLAGCISENRMPTSVQAKRVQFTELDRDENEYLTRDELPTHLELYLQFDRFDQDGNGRIYGDEFNDYLDAMRNE